MTDLSKVPFEELEAEYLRRKKEIKEQKRIYKLERHTCSNCVHSVRGRTNLGTFGEDTWVCEVKPKKTAGKYIRGPIYQRTYQKCNRYMGSTCTDFINKLSDEGKAIIKNKLTMADRFSE